MLGSATFTIDVSTVPINVPTVIAAVTTHLLTGLPPAAEAAGRGAPAAGRCDTNRYRAALAVRPRVVVSIVTSTERPTWRLPACGSSIAMRSGTRCTTLV